MKKSIIFSSLFLLSNTLIAETYLIKVTENKYIYSRSTLYNSVPFSGFAGHSYYGVCRTRIAR